MKLTSYHAKYFAFELTKQSSSDSMQKLASTLVDAQVDLNPHQVEAALFAFHSPLSKGAILADEVGLGKTIEAALVISQKWAERKRKIIIITPANLRKQWNQELLEKFFLPSIILETKSFNEYIKAGNLNPFNQPEIIICSYHFAHSKEPYLKKVNWDLVVIDEAHRLRNVYKSGNVIARSIKTALEDAPKILLTATPLQNSLMELYGLVSIIDDHSFGNQNSFKTQYCRVSITADTEAFNKLKERLKPICKRTLRRQVLEYISYTNRIALVQEFYPTEEEQRLYDLVSNYLQSENLYALPARGRNLMTLILRKLLASSTYAISYTLEALANKLEGIIAAEIPIETETNFQINFEAYDELQDEWENEDEPSDNQHYTINDIEKIKAEIRALKNFEALAKSISRNSKGEILFTALEKGFNEMERLGASKKAIIFTESTRTQAYLCKILEARGFEGKVVLFNGSNSYPKSKEIYAAWFERYKNTDKITGSRSAEMRAALVDYFRDEASIMIATEAAAEGINLQFCSFVINYDMPWNPQRIEQRIGRCHRYGQKHDVVVVNFLNKANAADVRVYELLQDKFKLFSGVFGASDEVLGSIESGIDFEKRIAEIYQNCRTNEEINLAFDILKNELQDDIEREYKNTRQKLLENFDEEVHEKLRMNLKESKEYLNRYEGWLWNISKYYLNSYAEFAEHEHTFTLKINPFPNTTIYSGQYKIGKSVNEVNIYRIGHPLAQQIIQQCKSASLQPYELIFNYTNSGKIISAIGNLVGKEGYLIGNMLTINSFEVEEFIQLYAITDENIILDKELCERFFSLPANVNEVECQVPEKIMQCLHDKLAIDRNAILEKVGFRNTKYFLTEIEKLDHWGEDRRNSFRVTLEDLDQLIKDKKRDARVALTLPEKLKIEKERKELQSKREAAWKDYDDAAKEIDKNKDELIDQIEKRLKQEIKEERMFIFKWKII